MPEILKLPPHARETILDHCLASAPEEACGLIAVHEGEVVAVYPTPNDSPSPEDSFVVPPPDHYRALTHAESRGWSLAGSYHSHPRGGAAPSDTDIAKALDPGWFYLVVGLGAAPRITGWRIRAGVATEVELG